MRSVPQNPLAQPLELLSRDGPRPTPSTMQLLRRHALADRLDVRPEQLLAEAQKIADAEPTADNIYAVAELAYIAGRKVQTEGDEPLALDMYGDAVANAYLYLVDNQFDGDRNPYDPRFRQACDLYNSALESAMRIVDRRGLLKPGQRHTLPAARQEFDFQIEVRGPWHEENIGELKFVSDYEVKGLTNHYHSYGLGVPLIAVYQRYDGRNPGEAYYPPGMSFPVPAFLRVLPEAVSRPPGGKVRKRCVLELHDTLAASDIRIGQRLVPLETDLTAPLAYCLDNEAFTEANVATRGLLSGDKTRTVQGLYMLEPYDPQKIPVVMVHGFWSSLITWMEMFNDLRGSPEIREHYQFWFYLYPTGQAYWITAAQLREELYRARMTLDPAGRARALDRMVLVGHSMGGLICQLETIDSRDEVWKLVSDKPFEEFRGPADVREKLGRLLFFHPDKSIERVVTIATPYGGSTISNGATQWLGRRLISLPKRLVSSADALGVDYPELFHDKSLLRITNSVDSMAADSPMLQLRGRLPRAPWVRYHNIVGVVDQKRLLGRRATGGDGVVSMASAQLKDADSELVVPADHTNIHRDPRTVLEVHRILQEHLYESRRAERHRTAGP